MRYRQISTVLQLYNTEPQTHSELGQIDITEPLCVCEASVAIDRHSSPDGTEAPIVSLMFEEFLNERTSKKINKSMSWLRRGPSVSFLCSGAQVSSCALSMRIFVFETAKQMSGQILK